MNFLSPYIIYYRYLCKRHSQRHCKLPQDQSDKERQVEVVMGKVEVVMGVVVKVKVEVVMEVVVKVEAVMEAEVEGKVEVVAERMV